MLTWAIGVAAILAQMLLAYTRLFRLRRRSQPSPDDQLAAPLARQLGISRHVTILENEEGSMPMTCGFLQPAICMPADARNWTEERRRMVLLHELAHVQRVDVTTHLLARLAFALNWWNPLAWLAWREFLKERERATDDLVLASGARPSDYAAHLLEVARGMQTSPALAWAAVAMARRSQLEGRLVAILDSRVRRNAAGRASAVAAVVAAIALVAPFAAVRAQNQAPQPLPADIDATIRAATAQRNFQMLEEPAASFEALRQFDNAKKLLDASLAIREQVSGNQSLAYGIGLMKLGGLEKKRNQPSQAVTFYSQAAQVLGDRPEAAPAWMYLGENALGNKNYQQAIDYFQKAQTLDADASWPRANVDGRGSRARAELRRGRNLVSIGAIGGGPELGRSRNYAGALRPLPHGPGAPGRCEVYVRAARLRCDALWERSQPKPNPRRSTSETVSTRRNSSTKWNRSTPRKHASRNIKAACSSPSRSVRTASRATSE